MRVKENGLIYQFELFGNLGNSTSYYKSSAQFLYYYYRPMQQSYFIEGLVWYGRILRNSKRKDAFKLLEKLMKNRTKNKAHFIPLKLPLELKEIILGKSLHFAIEKHAKFMKGPRLIEVIRNHINSYS